jgi:hypothetical protein
MTAERASELKVVTRETIDAMLDAGKIETAMRNGKWWRIRRNGATKHWKRDANRICIPYKAEMNVFGQITESDFDAYGVLHNYHFRLAD